MFFKHRKGLGLAVLLTLTELERPALFDQLADRLMLAPLALRLLCAVLRIKQGNPTFQRNRVRSKPHIEQVVFLLTLFVHHCDQVLLPYSQDRVGISFLEGVWLGYSENAVDSSETLQMFLSFL